MLPVTSYRESWSWVGLAGFTWQSTGGCDLDAEYKGEFSLRDFFRRCDSNSVVCKRLCVWDGVATR